MLNSVILIGRLVEKPVLKVYEGEYMVSTVTLAVARPFKNSQGEFDTDFIRVVLWDAIAKNACEYCLKGDIVAIRARLQSKYSEVSFNHESGEVLKKKINTLEVVGERVVYIASSSYKQNEKANIEES